MARAKEIRVQEREHVGKLNGKIPLTITARSVKAHALDTFGSEKKAGHWMNRPNGLLGGKTPLQVVESDPSQVEAALIRIDHGVYV